jgi:integrase
MTGIRTEEARSLHWDHVVAWVDEATGWQPVTKVGFDHQRFAVYIWRSVRTAGDTKTKKSRRTLELPDEVVQALRKHHRRQAGDKLKAGERWQENGLVFSTKVGTPLDASSVRRTFRRIATRRAQGASGLPGNSATRSSRS